MFRCNTIEFVILFPILSFHRNGGIPKEQIDMPKRPFFIMGALDAVAGIMQVFAVTYLSGPLIILLSQASIPVCTLHMSVTVYLQYFHERTLH